MNIQVLSNTFVVICFTLTVVACGGGGGSSAAPTEVDSSQPEVTDAREFDTSLLQGELMLIASNDPSIDLINPSVAANGDGMAALSWYQRNRADRSFWLKVYKEGFGWTEALMITEDVSNRSGSISVDGNGIVHIAWVTADKTALYANQYDHENKLNTTVRIDYANLTGTTELLSRIQLSSDAKGNAFLIWDQYSSDRGANQEIWLSRYEPATGWASAEPETVHGDISTISDRVGFPALTMNSKGDAIVAWVQRDVVDHINKIWASYYDSATQSWSTATNIDNRALNGGSPIVSMDETGNALVTWTSGESRPYKFDSNYYDVETGWGAVEAFGESREEQRDAAFVDDGLAVVLFSQYEDGTETLNSVQYSHRWSEQKQISPLRTPPIGEEQIDDVTRHGSGRNIAIWTRFLDDYSELYINIFDNGSWGDSVQLGAGEDSDAPVNGFYSDASVAFVTEDDALAAWEFENNETGQFVIQFMLD